jgi:hypothetical protein
MIHALRTYAAPAEAADTNARIDRARTWLLNATPDRTQERAFQALGFAWSHADEAAIADAVKGLQASQRTDGGWPQLPALESDIYATGVALFCAARGADAADASDLPRGREVLTVDSSRGRHVARQDARSGVSAVLRERLSLRTRSVDFRRGRRLRDTRALVRGWRLWGGGAIGPNRFKHVETDDFSPLQLNVTTTLNQAGSDTVFTQKIVYASKQERDGDFDSVSTSASEVYERLARYLESPRGK